METQRKDVRNRVCLNTADHYRSPNPNPNPNPNPKTNPNLNRSRPDFREALQAAITGESTAADFFTSHVGAGSRGQCLLDAFLSIVAEHDRL